MALTKQQKARLDNLEGRRNKLTPREQLDLIELRGIAAGRKVAVPRKTRIAVGKIGRRL